MGLRSCSWLCALVVVVVVVGCEPAPECAEPDSHAETSSGAASSGGESTTSGGSSGGPASEDSGPSSSTDGSGSSDDSGGGLKFDLPEPPPWLCPEPASHEDYMRFAVWVPVTGAVVKYQPDGLGYMLPNIGELARYRIAPSTVVAPGGVSVARDGRAAVGSSWGVAVFHSAAEGFAGSQWTPCHEGDGPTSVGALEGSYWLAEPLPWGSDVCLAWGVPVADAAPLVVAWTRGTWSAEICTYDAELWVAGAGGVRLLDGTTGAELAAAPLPAGVGPIADLVVDASGDAWGLVRGESLVHFDHDTLAATVHPLFAPGTGWALAIDHQSRPWVCDGTGAARWSGAWELTADWRDTPEAGALLDPTNAQGCAVNNWGELHVVSVHDGGYPTTRRIAPDLWAGWGEPLASTDQWGQPRTWGGLSFDSYDSAWFTDQAGERAYRAADTAIAAWIEGATLVGDAAGTELAELLE